jgi:hypothetical protein
LKAWKKRSSNSNTDDGNTTADTNSQTNISPPQTKSRVQEDGTLKASTNFDDLCMETSPISEKHTDESKSDNGNEAMTLNQMIDEKCDEKSDNDSANRSRRGSISFTTASDLGKATDHLTDAQQSELDICSVNMSMYSGFQTQNFPPTGPAKIEPKPMKLNHQAPAFKPSQPFFKPQPKAEPKKAETTVSPFGNSMAGALDSFNLNSEFTPSTPHVHKFRTEMCKNWELYGKCKYGDECSFAHDKRMMMIKTDVSVLYKTKMCKKFSANGYCPYGMRCQFIHDISEAGPLPERKPL